jgi:hypothetical protein
MDAKLKMLYDISSMIYDYAKKKNIVKNSTLDQNKTISNIKSK